MPSTYSTRLRLELIGTGEQTGSWGNTTNINLGTLLEESISGIASVTVADSASPTALTSVNGGTDQARQMIIDLGGTLTAAREVTCPNVQKLYFVRNGTVGGFAVTFKPTTGTGISVPNGKIRAVYCNATNVVDLITDLSASTQLAGSDIATTSTAQTLLSKTLTSPRVGTAILDTFGNELIAFTATGSAVNEITVTNAAGGGTPTISATGGDTNIGLNLVSKGSSSVFVNSVPAVTTTGIQTLTNKTISYPAITVLDSSFTLQDNADTTKQVRFETSGVASGATRIVTIPNFDYTLGQILNDSVVTASIANSQVTEAKIADGSITVNKIGAGAVTPAKLSQPITVGTTQATTSGTFKDFAIPAWARRIRLVFNLVSLSGSAQVRIQLGPSGGAQVTGYNSISSITGSGSAVATQTAGFDIYNNGPTSAAQYSGSIEFTPVDLSTNTWAASGMFGSTTGNIGTFVVAGIVVLTGALAVVRITSSNGTDTLDNGSANIVYD